MDEAKEYGRLTVSNLPYKNGTPPIPQYQGVPMNKLILATIVTFAFVSLAHAHPGGRDAYGGHYDNSTGKYHVHDGPLEGRTYNSQENMLKALEKAKGGPELIKKVEQAKKAKAKK